MEPEKEESDSEQEHRKAEITKYLQGLPPLTASEQELAQVSSAGAHATLADMQAAVASENVLDIYRSLVEQALSPPASPDLHTCAARYRLFSMASISLRLSPV